MNDNSISPNALREMAKTLLGLADQQEEIEREKGSSHSTEMRQGKHNADLSLEKHAPHLASIARQVYRQRLNRKKFFGNNLLGEPVWDIMVDLFIQHLEGRRVPITSACLASQVPASTALRHISVLEENEMVRRVASNRDNRVTYVELTDLWVLRMGQLMIDIENAWLLTGTSSAKELHLIIDDPDGQEDEVSSKEVS